MAVNINSAETPNPNARRYVVDRPVQEQSKGRFFQSAEEADEPLAKELLVIAGVDSVMLLPTSITVNKTNEADWEAVDKAARQAMESYFS